MFGDRERDYLERARIARLATASVEGHPHVVPVCFALLDTCLVTPIDEKPQRVSPDALRRSRDVRENPRVALLVDHYSENWSLLGWLQVRGTARYRNPGEKRHADGVQALKEKYVQYADHDLDARPLIRISPGSVRSWGRLEHPNQSH